MKRAAKIWNREQLAEVMGVHPDTIHEWQRAGMPVLKRGRRGRASRFDGAACFAWWNARREQLTPLEAAQVRSLNARTMLTELQVDRMSAGLLSAVDVDTEWGRYCDGWSAELRALPSRAAQQLGERFDAAGMAELCGHVLDEIEQGRRLGLRPAADDDQARRTR